MVHLLLLNISTPDAARIADSLPLLPVYRTSLEGSIVPIKFSCLARKPISPDGVVIRQELASPE